ncbi:Histone-lysine N-methyltransferase setd7 [Xenoophorus captivus]|uniref:Histone-lysine N-methyltransferase setd7 n=1 Tax=Xenoophorus captivus TaxID=1517983 RepID=A0ABV0RJ74_9TELE
MWTVESKVVFCSLQNVFDNVAKIFRVDSRDWALNGNTISLDDDTVIDVPQPFDQTERYCSSLGHKANHSFTPNCQYDP